MPTNEAPGHSRPVQAFPREQRHQLLHLPGQFWSLIPSHPLVRNIPDVAKRSAVGLFTNIKPLLVPIPEGGVLRAIKVLLLHPIPKGQVCSTGNFGAALGPLLPQAKQISKEVEMGLDSPIRLTKVDKD
jgi:hypothetical protein